MKKERRREMGMKMISEQIVAKTVSNHKKTVHLLRYRMLPQKKKKKRE